MTNRRALLIGLAAAGAAGCAGNDIEVTTTAERPTFEEFEAATYHEDFEYGVYIVNGDEPVEDYKALEEFWEMLYEDGALIVNRVGNQDDRWNDTVKLNLTYCISNSFGANKSKMVAAMATATDNGWEKVANVNFVYKSDQDANCTATNNNVVFDIRPTSGQSYLARAFFPNQSRPSRNVMVDSSSFGNLGNWTLAGILTHELGHALGFRHEHTRPEAGQCFEDNNWRALTTYDSTSVMHYPQCGGTGQPLTISTKDAQGAASLYGAPSGGGGTTPPPPPPPSTGTPQSGTASGSVAQGAWVQYQPQSVLAGSRFTVTMTGTGDPDHNVRFGAAPTATQYACRPYIDGASETCDLTVPAGQTQAYVGIHGYTAATYSINVSWTAP